MAIDARGERFLEAIFSQFNSEERADMLLWFVQNIPQDSRSVALAWRRLSPKVRSVLVAAVLQGEVLLPPEIEPEEVPL